MKEGKVFLNLKQVKPILKAINAFFPQILH
jgi:hypothetical protein